MPKMLSAVVCCVELAMQSFTIARWESMPNPSNREHAMRVHPARGISLSASMTSVAAQVVLHPVVSQSLKVWSTTVGRDKTYRAVQYFSRFLAWYLLSRGYKIEAARWNTLKSHLALGRKLMRLGKPLEHLQAALRALGATGPAVETITTVARQLSYFGYLTNDALVWANTVKVYNFKPSTAARINKLANQFWLAGILFSITFGLLKAGRLANEAKQLQSGPWTEKGVEAEREIQLKGIAKARDDARHQFIIDLLDIWVPATTLGLVNLNDGIVGIFGVISSVMALKKQWISTIEERTFNNRITFSQSLCLRRLLKCFLLSARECVHGRHGLCQALEAEQEEKATTRRRDSLGARDCLFELKFRLDSVPPPSHQSLLVTTLRMARTTMVVSSLLRASSSRYATAPVVVRARCLATPSSSKSSFTKILDEGPSLDDFITDNVPERVTLGNTSQPRLPAFLKTAIPSGNSFKKIRKDLRGLGLHTVCEEARCPNMGDCWGGKKGATEEESRRAATATIMLMGDTCTRGCRFCSVKTSRAPPPLDPHEPEHTAEAISRWGLGYVVLTSVDRDDLADGGAHHFAETIMKIKQKAPQILVEALTGDFAGNMDLVALVAKSGLDVYAHNIETVEELTPYVRDRRAKFRQSLAVLEHAKKQGVQVTKTSMMLGIGETEDQVMDALRELRKVNVDVVTFGQYMRPTKRHMKVDRYVEPVEFDHWRQVAEDMGFLYVASGPLVRSSYKAGEYFIENVLKGKAAERKVGQLAANSLSSAASVASSS
ncbi:hypothetical protein NM688_g1146 [Phlebia brevispora]|uniref:Uncharacterized protein n=1 Tax=Phlebia brevispora TaxID=194682 RepID=A0ACC1TCB3_9APHY|nr:hypothetical protein NM688_g1146 [Phlebia brevispora]